MWHDMATNSLMFSCHSHLHGTDEHIESQVHLKIQVALYSNVENKFNKIIKIILFVTFDVLNASWILELVLI